METIWRETDRNLVKGRIFLRVKDVAIEDIMYLPHANEEVNEVDSM